MTRENPAKLLNYFQKFFSYYQRNEFKEKTSEAYKGKKGGIITMEKPINISNLVLMNNKTKPAVKIDKKIKDKKITTKQKTKSKKK